MSYLRSFSIGIHRPSTISIFIRRIPSRSLSTMATTENSTSATTKGEEKKTVYDFAGKDGKFRRQVSSFRDWVSPDPDAEFPAEKDRYVCAPSLCDSRRDRPEMLIIDPIQGAIHQPGMSMGVTRKSCEIVEGPRGCYTDCNDGFCDVGGRMVCPSSSVDLK